MRRQMAINACVQLKKNRWKPDHPQKRNRLALFNVRKPLAQSRYCPFGRLPCVSHLPVDGSSLACQGF